MLEVLARLLSGLWAGSLCTICGIVAPTLFATLDDRRLAGQLAGRFFSIVTWLGLALGIVIFVIVFAHRSVQAKKALLWLIGLTAFVPFQVQDQVARRIAAARAAGDTLTFEFAHALGAISMLAACFGALGVMWALTRRAG